MTVRLIRHATLLLEAGGRRLLVDPMLDPAGARPPVADSPRARPNPLVELPEAAERVVAAADAVLVTHLHADHLDATADRLIGDRRPVFCQPEDAERLVERGLARATPVAERLAWDGIEIARTGGRHGTGTIADRMGPVSGFVIRAEERCVYVAGDTVWCREVQEAIDAHAPDVVIVNAGGARFLEGDPITMTAADVAEVRAAAPDAVIVAVHLDAINHCVESREELRRATAGTGIVIPQDGETITL